MKSYIFIFLFTFFGYFIQTSNAQLANGSIAPDFTLTDIYGVEHNLYNYLDQGKTVYIDFFAAHCPFCWSYHNTHALADLHTMHGPGTASDDVFVIAIELDANNGTNEIYGTGGNTQGNWVEGTFHPIINIEGSDRTEIIAAYKATFYPLIYAICPNRTIVEIGKKNTEELYQQVETCETLVKNNDQEWEEKYSFVQHKESIEIQMNQGNITAPLKIRILSTSGNVILDESIQESNPVISTSSLIPGIYIIQLFENQDLIFAKKIFQY